MVFVITHANYLRTPRRFGGRQGTNAFFALTNVVSDVTIDMFQSAE